MIRVLCVLAFFSVSVLGAQEPRRPTAVTFDRILRSDQEPQNWLTYSGTLSGWRYSPLTQITSANINELELEWIWQAQTPLPGSETTALVVDGVLYTVQAPNDVVALDAATGRRLWTYAYAPKLVSKLVPVRRINRGLAILGNTLFIGTLDAHLLAINASSGMLVWSVKVADAADPLCNQGRYCYSVNVAPLVVKDKVIIGPAGADGLIRGFIAAFDAGTGREVWRFATIPGPGELGHETWSGESWKTGGGSVWNTGTYDPDLNLTYWGVGNPAPYDATVRPGDNLYTDSVIALDADTGKLRWYYQFTPHDEFDWDSTQVPVLTEIQWQGQPRKVMLFANRNGLMYVLDRLTGEFLLGKPFVEVNWMSGFDAKGRPVRTTVALNTGFDSFDSNGKRKATTSANPPLKPGPGELGATNWYPPSVQPKDRLVLRPCVGVIVEPALQRDTGARSSHGRQKMGVQEGACDLQVGCADDRIGPLVRGCDGPIPPGDPSERTVLCTRCSHGPATVAEDSARFCSGRANELLGWRQAIHRSGCWQHAVCVCPATIGAPSEYRDVRVTRSDVAALAPALGTDSTLSHLPPNTRLQPSAAGAILSRRG